jgi:hypothetical protein
VICNPLGKSGGALIQQFMIIGFGSLAASTPYLGVILLSIVLLWIQAANSLAGQFAELQKEVRVCAVQGVARAVLRCALPVPAQHPPPSLLAVAERMPRVCTCACAASKQGDGSSSGSADA